MDTYIIKANDPRIDYLKQKDRRLSVVIEKIGDMTCHIHEDGYSFIVEEIVGQMLSNKVADVITDRLINLCGGLIEPEKISQLSVDDFQGIGLSRAKSEYIMCFNCAIVNGEIDLPSLDNKSDEEIMKQLMSIRGIGSWTSKMYLLFVLQRENVLPYEDGAFLQAYKWLYNTNLSKPEDVKKDVKNGVHMPRLQQDICIAHLIMV